MRATVASLGIDHLPRDERIALAQEIWDTIAAEAPSLKITESQRIELARRIAEDNASLDDVISWEQVKADALARFQQP